MNQKLKPKVIDVFAGIGGFSLGAIRAGFDLVATVDLDRHVTAMHKKNFPNTPHGRRNVLNLNGTDLRELASLNGDRLSGLIGGPPCQGFSTIGKMRKNDARNKLFYHFFRLVSELKPLFFIAENVPGILGEKYDALREESFKLVSKHYEMLEPIELSAGDFGAATTRGRVFFIGFAKDSGIDLASDNFNPPYVPKASVRKAFAGLPSRIGPDWQTEELGWREINVVNSRFFKAINRITSDIVGDKTALRRFLGQQEVSGFLGTRHSSDLKIRYGGLKPGGVDETTKSRRLEWDGLCPTLRAGTGPERGSFQAVRPIHPSYSRVIVPREAARLQGFPDWFQFSPTKWHSFRQIGNSIPPLLAEGVLRPIASAIM